MTELQALAEDVLTGDTKAFDLLYDRFFPPIYHFSMLRTESQAAAQRLCQEIFEEVFEKLPGARSEPSLEVWVHRRARRVASRHAQSNSNLAAGSPGARAPIGLISCAAGK